jgi:hypothetical protein
MLSIRSRIQVYSHDCIPLWFRRGDQENYDFLNIWKKNVGFTDDQHKKVLQLLGKTEKDWDNLLHHRRVRENYSFRDQCVKCNVMDNPPNVLLPCGCYCMCGECAKSSSKCRKCFQPLGDQKPISIWTWYCYKHFISSYEDYDHFSFN